MMKRSGFIKKMSVGMKASIVYTLSSLLSRGLAIITVPIFTRLMSTEQIGVVNLFTSWQSMIGAVATLSLTSGGFMVAMREYEHKRNQYMSSVLTLTSLVALVLSIVYIMNPAFWNALLELPTPLVALMLVGYFVTPATDFWLARQRYEYKYIKAGILTMISAIASSIFAVVAVVYASKRGIGDLATIRLYSGYLVTYGVAIIIWLTTMLKGKTFINKDFWTFSLGLSIPLIGNSIAMQVLSVSDRAMIGKMINNSAVGIYSILYTVSSLSLIVWSAINSSYVPFLYENIEKVEKKESIRKSSTSLMLAYGIIAIVLTLIAPEIVRVLATEEYYEAIYIMPPIAAGIFLTSISNMYSNILVYLKKTKYIMISSGLAAMLNVVLNYIFINKYGYIAAAYTTLFAYIILAFSQAIIASYESRRILKNEYSVYDNRKLAGISVVTILLCIACLPLYSMDLLRYFIIILMLMLTFLFRKKILNLIGYKRNVG